MYDRILLSTDGTAASMDAESHALEEHGEETIAEIRKRASDAGVDCVETLRHGRPSNTIVDYADETDTDLLVLGTKRRPNEYRALLGSVTDRVLRLTERPVLVEKTEVEA